MKTSAVRQPVPRPFLFSIALSLCLHLFVVADKSVLHFTLPGHVPQTHTGPGEVVVAEVFIKTLVSPNGRRWRGIAFFASIEPVYHTWGGDLSMPPAVVAWKPIIYLRSVTSGKVHNATVIDNHPARERNQKGETRLALPTRFYGTLPEAEDLYELHIADWDRYGLVSSKDAWWEENEAVPEHWVVLPPIRNVPDLRLDPALLVAHSTNYHCALGFHVSAYVLPHQLEDFTNNAELQSHIESGNLELTIWGQVSECTHFSSCQHAVQNSHATLAGWGQQRLLTFLDVDEFIAFPDNISVHNFRDACMQNFSQVTFQRFDLKCYDCTEESSLWYGPKSKLFPHPLTNYGKILGSHPYSAGKSTVDSNQVLGFAIHHGHRLSGDGMELKHTCGRVLHIVNMFSMRTTSTGHMVEPGTWRRPFFR